MSGTGDKLRLAIAAFYDADRLAGALRDFVLLGLLADDLCLLTDHHCGSLFAPLSGNSVTAKLIPDAPLIFCTNTPVLGVLRRARTATGATCMEALFQGEVGEEIKAHLRNRAVIAIVKADTPKLQDHCVRVLLRHSLHTVHTEECRYQTINTDAPRDGA